MRWYRDKIGQTVPFLGDVGSEYKSRETSGYTNFVQKADAEIVNIDETMNELIKINLT